MNNDYTIPELDLEHIKLSLNKDINDYSKKKIFITGASGFFGKWIVEALIYLNDSESLGMEIIVLSRNVENLALNCPKIKNRSDLKVIEGDLLSLDLVIDEDVDYIIHAATEASDKVNTLQPLVMLDTIINGTRNILNIAKRTKTRRILNFSSGAVYGPMPEGMTHFHESFMGGPDLLNTKAAYAEGKRISELLMSIALQLQSISTISLRCFAFVGPHLKLSEHFAIGNFMYNVLHGQQIVIRGDGTPLRSYMYMSDLVIWTLSLLVNFTCTGVVNVGSDIEYSIEEVANKVNSVAASEVDISVLKEKKPNQKIERYVPDISRARSLGLKISIELDEAIRKTLDWYSQKKKN